MVLLKPLGKTLFSMGSPHPSLAEVLEGLGVLNEGYTSVFLMFHGDGADGISILVPPKVAPEFILNYMKPSTGRSPGDKC